MVVGRLEESFNFNQSNVRQFNPLKKLSPLVSCQEFFRSTKTSLISSERNLVIELVSYYGRDGKIFPSIETIADSMQLSRRTVRRLLRSLEQKKIITRDYRKGRSTIYRISFLHDALQDDKVLTNLPVDNLSIHEKSYPQTPDISPQKLSTTPDIYVRGGGHPCPGGRTSMSSITDNINNKNNSVWGMDKKRPAPTLNNFLPDEENQKLASELKLDIKDQVERFKNRYRGKGGNLHYEFNIWMKDSRAFLDRQGTRAINAPMQNEVRSTVPEFNEGHPAYDVSKSPRGDVKVASSFMDQIKKRLGMPSKTPPEPQISTKESEVGQGVCEVAPSPKVRLQTKFESDGSSRIDAFKLSNLYANEEAIKKMKIPSYIQ